jgi:hypothetical protein
MGRGRAILSLEAVVLRADEGRAAAVAPVIDYQEFAGCRCGPRLAGYRFRHRAPKSRSRVDRRQ